MYHQFNLACLAYSCMMKSYFLCDKIIIVAKIYKC